MSSEQFRITMELPPEIAELSEEESARLEEAFKEQIANVLSDKVPDSLLDSLITNVTGGGGIDLLGPLDTAASTKSGKKKAGSKKHGKKAGSKKRGKKGGSKKGGKKGGKGAAKKSRRRG